MFKTLNFLLRYPRIGPDMFLTHWLLYFKPIRLGFQKYKLLEIGEGSEIRPFVTINGTDRVKIGKNVVVKPGSILSTSPGDGELITIEDDVLFAPNVSIYAHSHRTSRTDVAIRNQGVFSKPVLIRRGAWLGINSVILPGVTVGPNAVVGAGAIVTRDVPGFTVVAGQPAQVISDLSK